PRVAVRGRPFDAGDGEPAAHAARADDHLFGPKPEAAFCLDSVRVGEARDAGAFMDGHSNGIDLSAEGGMGSHVVRDPPGPLPCEKPTAVGAGSRRAGPPGDSSLPGSSSRSSTCPWSWRYRPGRRALCRPV